jgi:uncharacterized protein (DUF3820 family)
MTGTIIPFGKYKGRLVEEIVADDPGYLEWLSGQDWFRAKYVMLHQVIINRGAEPSETPDHNAMQVLFLDDEFCLRFLKALDPKCLVTASSRLQSIHQRDWGLIVQTIDRERKALEQAIATIEQPLSDDDWRRKQALRDRDQHAARLEYLHRVQQHYAPPIKSLRFAIVKTFEQDGVDVALQCGAGSAQHELVPGERRPDCEFRWRSTEWRGRESEDWVNLYVSLGAYRIELKPAVGDDYPAVLRQMRANGSKVLLVGSYTGQGATREQFVKTFATADIRVVFRDEIEALK